MHPPPPPPSPPSLRHCARFRRRAAQRRLWLTHDGTQREGEGEREREKERKAKRRRRKPKHNKISPIFSSLSSLFSLSLCLLFPSPSPLSRPMPFAIRPRRVQRRLARPRCCSSPPRFSPRRLCRPHVPLHALIPIPPPLSPPPRSGGTSTAARAGCCSRPWRRWPARPSPACRRRSAR